MAKSSGSGGGNKGGNSGGKSGGNSGGNKSIQPSTPKIGGGQKGLNEGRILPSTKNPKGNS